MPILREGELEFVSHGVEQTQRLGARLGRLLEAGDVVCLSGEMGAGKTVFTAGIGAGWEVESRITSPTFTLVHEHRRERDGQRLFHVDCYRMQTREDAASVGLEEMFDGRGPVIVEWPENIESVLPPTYLWVDLRIVEQTRRNLTFEAQGKRYDELIAKFREMTFGV